MAEGGPVVPRRWRGSRTDHHDGAMEGAPAEGSEETHGIEAEAPPRKVSPGAPPRAGPCYGTGVEDGEGGGGTDAGADPGALACADADAGADTDASVPSADDDADADADADAPSVRALRTRAVAQGSQPQEASRTGSLNRTERALAAEVGAEAQPSPGREKRQQKAGGDTAGCRMAVPGLAADTGDADADDGVAADADAYADADADDADADTDTTDADANFDADAPRIDDRHLTTDARTTDDLRSTPGAPRIDNRRLTTDAQATDDSRSTPDDRRPPTEPGAGWRSTDDRRPKQPSTDDRRPMTNDRRPASKGRPPPVRLRPGPPTRRRGRRSSPRRGSA